MSYNVRAYQVNTEEIEAFWAKWEKEDKLKK